MAWKNCCNRLATALSALCLAMLSACSTVPEVPPWPPLPPTLMQPCPDLAAIPDGQLSTLARQMVKDAEQYATCADRLKKIQAAAKLRQQLDSLYKD